MKFSLTLVELFAVGVEPREPERLLLRLHCILLRMFLFIPLHSVTTSAGANT